MDDISSERLLAAREVVRMSELYLDGTVRASAAKDSRAMSLAAMSATGSTALLGIGLNYLLKTNLSKLDLALGWGAIYAGLILLAALLLALRAASPRPLTLPGTKLSLWTEDELSGKNLSDVLIEQARNYESHIDHNVKTLAKNARRLQYAMIAILLAIGTAPAVSLAVWQLSN